MCAHVQILYCMQLGDGIETESRIEANVREMSHTNEQGGVKQDYSKRALKEKHDRADTLLLYHLWSIYSLVPRP